MSHDLGLLPGHARRSRRSADVADQRVIEPSKVEGITVAGIGDLAATKLHVIVHRPEAVAAARAPVRRRGLALFVERYQPASPEQAVSTVMRSLAYFDDVPDDPALPMRVGEIAAHLDRHGLTPNPTWPAPTRPPARRMATVISAAVVIGVERLRAELGDHCDQLPVRRSMIVPPSCQIPSKR